MQNTQRNSRYIWWMAWKNLLPKTKRNGLSFMTFISISGVAIGVAALIVVLSVMGGFENDLKDKMLRGRPHMEVVSENAAIGFALKDQPLSKYEQLFPEAIHIEPFVQADAVLKQNRHLASAVLFGIDPTRGGKLWGFAQHMVEGDVDAIGKNHQSLSSWDTEVRRPGILLGEELAIQLGAEKGDEITVLSPQAGADTALSGGTVTRIYVVAGKFKTELFDYDAKWAVVSLDEGRKFMADYDTSLDRDEYVSGIAINVPKPLDIDEYESRIVAAEIEGKQTMREGFSGLAALTWKKVNKSLLFALKLEKFAMGSILMLIVLVAGFSISGTMMMTVFHKRGQVSLLRSLGMTKNDITKLFLTHGCTIGGVGVATGMLFGLVITFVLSLGEIIALPKDVYQLTHLPVKWLWGDYVIIGISAWALSLLAAAYPAFTASRQDPGVGLRYL